MKSKLLILFLFSIGISKGYAQSIHEIWLDDLVIQKYSEGIPGISAKKNGGGETMTIGKKLIKEELVFSLPVYCLFY